MRADQTAGTGQEVPTTSFFPLCCRLRMILLKQRLGMTLIAGERKIRLPSDP
jgi:hypothetical protein